MRALSLGSPKAGNYVNQSIGGLNRASRLLGLCGHQFGLLVVRRINYFETHSISLIMNLVLCSI